MDTYELRLDNGRLIKGCIFEIANPTHILLIQTGMAEYAARYKDFAHYLNGLGFSVYVNDAFGQGLNALSKERQLEVFPGSFDSNVLALSVKIKELKEKYNLPIFLMGHSMGSFMVQRYMELYPDTVNAIILCGTNGPATAKMKFGYPIAKFMARGKRYNKKAHFMTTLGLGPYVKSVKDRKTDLDWLSYDEDNVNSYINDPYCGARPTNGFWKEFIYALKKLHTKKEMAKISKNEKVLIISGAEDPVGECSKGPKRLAKKYHELGLTNVTLILNEKMRHEILNETNKEMVYKQFSDFLLNN